MKKVGMLDLTRGFSATAEATTTIEEVVELRSLLFFFQERAQQLESLLILERSINSCLESCLKKIPKSNVGYVALRKQAANNSGSIASSEIDG